MNGETVDCTYTLKEVAEMGWQPPGVAAQRDEARQALRVFDDRWYPLLAGMAIGKREAGEERLAGRLDALCDEWRALVTASRAVLGTPTEGGQ